MSKNRGNFENAWKNAMEGSEVTPPTSVWDSIQEEMNEKKERKLFILPKMLVAASLFLALSVGLYYGFFDDYSSELNESLSQSNTETDLKDSKSTSSKPSENLASKEPDLKEDAIHSEDESTVNQGGDIDSSVAFEDKDQNATKSDLVVKDGSGQEGLLAENADIETQNVDFPGQQYYNSNTSNSADSNGILEKDNNGNQSSDPNLNLFVVQFSGGDQIALLDNIDPQSPDWDVDYVDIYAIPTGYDLIEEEKNGDKTLFLAGLNYSAGVFSPNSGGQSSADAASSIQNPIGFFSSSLVSSDFSAERSTVISDFRVDREDNYEESVAMSYGANFGVHLTDRLVLFSGLNYTRAFSDLKAGVSVTETQNVLADGFYGVSESREKVVNEYSYTIENEFEFASIPLKAGYAVVNSQFNLMLMTGISTDILLNVNRETEDAEISYYNTAVEKTTEESFNSVYFNGLLGISAGYLLSDHYFVYVEPSYRRAINSFFREDNSNGMANFKMITVGLSYRFK